MLKLDISKKAADFVSDLPPKQFRQIIKKVLALMSDPEPTDSKLLTGSSFMRADIGEYRIIYRLDKDTLIISLIGKRNDGEVYRDLKRL